ncbi:Mitochondrial substrate carrier family protein D [Armadillidium vulgare]|nr:Mitochondrial substrate carrier family protein D [Armadillidium vulgare]
MIYFHKYEILIQLKYEIKIYETYNETDRHNKEENAIKTDTQLIEERGKCRIKINSYHCMPLRTVASGGIAGICFWISVFPFDVIKSRVQVQNTKDSIVRFILRIYKSEGFYAFYNGLTRHGLEPSLPLEDYF